MGVHVRISSAKLQGAVATTFARLFGGSVHPTEVADALQSEASSHLQHQAGRTIAPNRYTVQPGTHRSRAASARTRSESRRLCPP